jgi:hypothetical protein
VLDPPLDGHRTRQFPGIKAGTTGSSPGADGLGMSRWSLQKEAGWSFYNRLFSPDVAKEICLSETLYPPTRISVIQDPEVIAAQPLLPAYEAQAKGQSDLWSTPYAYVGDSQNVHRVISAPCSTFGMTASAGSGARAAGGADSAGTEALGAAVGLVVEAGTEAGALGVAVSQAVATSAAPSNRARIRWVVISPPRWFAAGDGWTVPVACSGQTWPTTSDPSTAARAIATAPQAPGSASGGRTVTRSVDNSADASVDATRSRSSSRWRGASNVRPAWETPPPITTRSTS